MAGAPSATCSWRSGARQRPPQAPTRDATVDEVAALMAEWLAGDRQPGPGGRAARRAHAARAPGRRGSGASSPTAAARPRRCARSDSATASPSSRTSTSGPRRAAPASAARSSPRAPASRPPSGADLVFIVADDDDWPKQLYAKLGFTPLGRPRPSCTAAAGLLRGCGGRRRSRTPRAGSARTPRRRRAGPTPTAGRARRDDASSVTQPVPCSS